MSIQKIDTKNAPSAIGPYSQAVKAGDLIYTSGQIPIDPLTGEVAAGGIEIQARQVFENLKAVLAEGGADFSKVTKTTVFLKNLADFTAFNEIYSTYFKEPFPARSCIEVSRLPKDVLVEIEAVAYTG